MEKKSLQIRRIVILFFIFIFLYFPVYCLAALIRTGNAGRFLWALPDFRNPFSTAANGVFFIWPVVLILIWTMPRSRWAKEAFRILVSRRNFDAGWKIAILLYLYYFLCSLLPLRFKYFWAFIFTIPVLGLIAVLLLRRSDGFWSNVFRLGWGISWRLAVFDFIFYLFGAVVSLFTMYVCLWPALALIEVIGDKKVAFVEILQKFQMLGPVYTPVLIFFANFDRVTLLFLWASLVIIANVFIPGLAFWKTTEKLGYGKD